MEPQSTKLTALSVQVRWMIRRDFPEVLSIEGESFEFPWAEEDFRCCLSQRNCIGMVAEHAGKIVGFMVYELFNERMHLMSLAVAKAYRLQGVGTAMVWKLVNKLSQQRRTHITLEVRETNLGAQLFLKRLRFKAVGVLTDHFEDTAEDAYAFEFTLNGEGD